MRPTEEIHKERQEIAAVLENETLKLDHVTSLGFLERLGVLNNEYHESAQQELAEIKGA